MSTNYLVVGLGNVGFEYERTRHNIGFMVLDKLASLNNLTFETDRLAQTSLLKHKGKNIYLIKPTTFMNLSGRSLAFWMHYYKIPQENIFVICDDLHLNFGSIRIRAKGSSGGQNGLNNINEVLQSENYARMRMGIGNNFAKGRQSEYVLGAFDSEQVKLLPDILGKATDAILSFCLEGLDICMNKYNSKS